jgi:hypothetical protein
MPINLATALWEFKLNKQQAHCGQRKRPKRKEKDDAIELWRPSPTPSEDWGSDANVEFERFK